MVTETNDPDLKSWVPVPAESDFPIQNLPYGIFRRRGTTDEPCVCVAIGDQVLDLAALHAAGHFVGTSLAGENVFDRPYLNDFMATGRSAWTAARQRISELLRDDCPKLRDDAALRDRVLLDQQAVELLMPVFIRDYTDFYSSMDHARNVGAMFRDPKNALLPNWKHLPVGYHGRASSVVVSDVDIHRPCGQTKADDADLPTYGPCRLLDFELEMGFLTGTGNRLGGRISTAEAADHIFGMVLLNDWSARDIQKWEYVPLGPFLAKSFASSISPWVVTLDALDPFRVPGPKQNPPVLPYLRYEGDWAFDIHLEVALQSAQMNGSTTICRSNFKFLYWNVLQQLAHQAVVGTNVGTGDLYGSGTVSGPTEDSRGSMLEICWKGTKPLTLPTGEQRKFLADGDTVIMRGHCQNDAYRIGFGEVRTVVLPAIE